MIESKNTQMEAVKETVKNEVKSFSDVVKQGSKDTAVTVQKLKSVVNSAVKREDRSKSVMVYGIEEGGVGESLEGTVIDMMSTMSPYSRTSIQEWF